jgi:surface polysaccharide O-acyltransferase-like enzyme
VERWLFVDHLRNLVVLSLILFHTARLFDHEPWHMKDAHAYRAADVFVMMLNQWGMPLLFLLAGTSAAFSLQRRGPLSFTRERATRLLLPLLFGILLIVPPQVYLERISPQVPLRASPVNFSGSFLSFYPEVFRCCYPAANFSWHHLWFIAYLFLYSILLLPLFAALTTLRGRHLTVATAGWFASGRRVLLLGIPVVLIESLLRARFPSSHDIVNDAANHAHFVWMLLAGWLFSDRDLVRAAGRLMPGTAVLALAISLSAAALHADWLGPDGRSWWRPLWAAGEWCWIVVLIGFAQSRLDRPLVFLTAFTVYGFAFYILHQTVIVGFGWLLFDWQDRPFAKFIAIATASFAVSLWVAMLCRGSRSGRLMLGIPAKPSGP